MADAKPTTPDDPGPLPAVVEPETTGNVTTIFTAGAFVVHVTRDVGRTGYTGLTIEGKYGESVTAALPLTSIPLLVAALLDAAAPPEPTDAPAAGDADGPAIGAATQQDQADAILRAIGDHAARTAHPYVPPPTEGGGRP